MILQTLAKRGSELRVRPMQIELVRGMPIVHFLNMTGPKSKDSAIRLRTAFKKSGYVWPRAQSVIVNFPSDAVGWQPEGLDLPLAIAVLLLTGAMDFDSRRLGENIWCGDIGLTGEISVPLGLREFQGAAAPVISGIPEAPLAIDIEGVSSLTDLTRHNLRFYPKVQSHPQCPPRPTISWSSVPAELMAVVAAGEHSLLLAGAQGVGKSTFAECVHAVLPPPSEELWSEIMQIGQWIGEVPLGRPLRVPHHTLPARSMLGGGSPIVVGEITRAHGGVLVMDEFLEFGPQVQEALREPLEKGSVAISRRGEAREFPARFQLLATSNLCPCGRLEAGDRLRRSCPQSLTRCRSVVQRLSGPVLDRIEIFASTENWHSKSKVSVDQIAERVARAREFSLQQRGQRRPNGHLSVEEIRPRADLAVRLALTCEQGVSLRRERSLLRVARTCADLRGSEVITVEDLRRATDFVEVSRRKLHQLFA